jgi:hypothetical protein
MIEPRHLDGNAIGSLLIDFFGRDMTDARGRCAGCGSVSAIGALIVHRSGPGDVVRCPSCGIVLLVVSALADGPRIYLAALDWVQTAS